MIYLVSWVDVITWYRVKGLFGLYRRHDSIYNILIFLGCCSLSLVLSRWLFTTTLWIGDFSFRRTLELFNAPMAFAFEVVVFQEHSLPRLNGKICINI